jgi:NAD+ kinase
VGVNFGRVGFLAAFDLEGLRRLAGSLFGGGELDVEERMLLEVTARCGASGEERCRQLALNDAAVVAGPPYRMISVALELDGVAGPVIQGDGVIVATGTGSTGYSVSAGGPIVAPGVEAMSVSAIAAHSLGFRPLVIPGGCRLLMRMEQVNPREEERAARERVGGVAAAEGEGVGTTLVLDGQWQTRVYAGDEVEVVRSSRRAMLVRNPERSYYETLMRKMYWAARPTGD